MSFIKSSILATSIIFSFSVHAKDAYNEGVMTSHSSIEDSSLGDWGGKWWQWAFSFERAKSPITDLSGELCSMGQEGSVWFLAGSYSTSPVHRKCSIPFGKKLFFPVINSMYYSPKNKLSSCESVTVSVKQRTQYPANLFVSINGSEIKDPYLHREATEKCFDPFKKLLPDSTPKSWAYPGASDGYWIAVASLPVGKHTLHFGGEISNFSQDITYELTIVPST